MGFQNFVVIKKIHPLQKKNCEHVLFSAFFVSTSFPRIPRFLLPSLGSPGDLNSILWSKSFQCCKNKAFDCVNHGILLLKLRGSCRSAAHSFRWRFLDAMTMHFIVEHAKVSTIAFFCDRNIIGLCAIRQFLVGLLELSTFQEWLILGERNKAHFTCNMIPIFSCIFKNCD